MKKSINKELHRNIKLYLTMKDKLLQTPRINNQIEITATVIPDLKRFLNIIQIRTRINLTYHSQN